MGAEESKIICQSPRCQKDINSISRCYKHQHNYSWYCKYCKTEEEAIDKEMERKRQIEQQQWDLDQQQQRIAELERKQEELQRELDERKRGY